MDWIIDHCLEIIAGGFIGYAVVNTYLFIRYLKACKELEDAIKEVTDIKMLYDEFMKRAGEKK